MLQRAGGRCRPRRVKQGGKKRKRQEEVEEGEEKRCRLFSSSLSRCPLPSSTTLSTSPKPRSRPTPVRRGKKLVIFFLYVEKSEKRRKVEETKKTEKLSLSLFSLSPPSLSSLSCHRLKRLISFDDTFLLLEKKMGKGDTQRRSGHIKTELWTRRGTENRAVLVSPSHAGGDKD